MALAEAEIELGEELDGRPTAMVFSNALGPLLNMEKILSQIERQGPLAVSPALFTESVSNAPAAQVALACRAKGANITVTQREAGPLMALARAATELSRGRAGYAVVATVDEVTPLLHAVLDRYRALARADENGCETARPFDRRRNGLVLAEGATALIVEKAESAARRGIPVLARLAGTASAFDPTASAAGWGRDPKMLIPALVRLVGERLGDVEAIVSGAAGSRAGDRLEAIVLAGAWGDRPLPPILTPKAVLGEYGGAQLIAAILALAAEPFGPTPGFSEPDPALGISPHAGGALAPSTVLVSSLATGGAASWALLEKGEV
jgi:3-oxoacyl-[acyl-carrier-protein] synthase II